MDEQNNYVSVLSSRYCSVEMRFLFSNQKKFSTWRYLWYWLAECQANLGLEISKDQLEELENNVFNIDFANVAEYEKEFRHDVMAHIKAYKDQCPKAGGIIHLGATSAFVQDNTDLILMKEALSFVLLGLGRCISHLKQFADSNKDLVTLGRTHYQRASLTTVGKRACLWLQDLVMCYNDIEALKSSLRFRGIKGATGTKDSFLTIFNGDRQKVEKLNEMIAKKAGFESSFLITGQTYPRIIDAKVINKLAEMGAVVNKICTDVRLLQAFEEIQEPFEKNQVGSSAMPYKRNPIRCERCCGISQFLISLPQNSLNIAARQGFERTLDDSSNRRLVLPEAFLCSDALLMTFQNIVQGLIVHKALIHRHVKEELPFVCLEQLMLMSVKHHGNRQEAHERIRILAQEAYDAKVNEREFDVISAISKDPFFAEIKLDLDERKFIGTCIEDVDEFLKADVQPILSKYDASLLEKTISLNV